MAVDRPDPAESFRSQLLLYRSRSRLTQREFAARAGVHFRSVQDWETGANFPTAERLRGLIAALLETGGLSVGHEAEEAQTLWAAVQRDSPRMHAPFDSTWFDRLPQVRATPAHPLDSDIASASGFEPAAIRQSWGEAPDTLGFVDRVGELELLRRWVLVERCRLIGLLGIGGIGKTSLAAKLAHDVAPSFERVYWRSLRDAPPPGEWLAGVIGFLSHHQLVPPPSESEQRAALLQLLRDRRCLLVLDNSEALFQPGEMAGRYGPGMAGYGRMLQAVGGGTHQSCLVLTSREAPHELTLLANGVVRIVELGGLGVDEAQVLLAPKQLTGSSQQWCELNDFIGGNGLALKVVGETIRELFAGDIGEFVKEAAGGGVFGGIRPLLTEQIDRSSPLEQLVLRVLAVDREPVPLTALMEALGPRVGRASVMEAIEALRRRSLVERADTPGAAAFALQSVVLEYVTDRLVGDVSAEIRHGQAVIMHEQPLIKAQAKDYVRQTQERLIGAPILQQLKQHQGERGIEPRLLGLLDRWRGGPSEEQGYGPGNVVNLLRLLRGDLRELDLSRLAIRQAYLAQVDAQHTSLMESYLAETVLAEAFYFPPSVALSADGALLAAGTSTGQVWLWRVADRTPLWLADAGHTGVVFGVALSADGRLLASCGSDGLVRLWETSSGRPMASLHGHIGAIWSVALSTDAHLVVSGGADGTVRLWETSTAVPMATLQGHAGMVRGVAASADGHLFASSGDDGIVKLWESTNDSPLATLDGHIGTVWSVALSPDGHLVASGGADGTVRLWSLPGVPGGEQSMLGTRASGVPPSAGLAQDAGTGRTVRILQATAAGTVWGVALSADGQQVASGGADGTVRLWDVSTGRPMATLSGHAGPVWGVALSAQGQLVASGSFDGSIKLWEASTARQVATLQGITGAVFGVALAADGKLLATGHTDATARLWEVETARPITTLKGHTGAIYGVALSGEGQLLATCADDGLVKLWQTSTGLAPATLEGHSGTVFAVALSRDGRVVGSSGSDGTVRLWDSGTGQVLAILDGHSGTVWSVALSADGQLAASGGEDGTVRLWDSTTGQTLAILEGHSGTVWGVALSADSKLVASSGEDGTLRLWGSGSRQALAILEGHSGTVYSVALSADGLLAATGGADGTVRLWATSTGQPLATLHGHAGTVRCVTVSADGQLVASGGHDGTVKLWESRSGACLRTVQPERRYERLDIAGLTGITEAQRTALLALGAVEHRPTSRPTAAPPLESVR